ncbi:MAG TPA: 50S ribosomal protein L29 [Patescibacteria group bacterium]|nr:50S ribosomal protein L29 [Patescibacteria group bacterium]
MKMKELRARNQNELIKTLSTLREQVRDLKFKVHSKEVKDSHRLKNVRQDIARILTILNEPESDSQKA